MTEGIEVRRYLNIAQFQVDAAQMAAAGWHVVAQSEQTGGVNGSWIGVAVGAFLGGFLVGIWLWVVSLLALVAAVVGRARETVVTYRYGS